MLRFHQNSAAADAKRYYTQSDYLSEGQETAGLWGGRAATLLGLRGTVDRESFDHLCDNLHPVTGETLTARKRSDRTVGNDVTFDVPKSVSVYYELTRDERIADAFRRSVQETMREIEADAKTRVRKNGADHDRTTSNLVWGTFYHSTSRPEEDGVPDPQMHAHCFVFNSTWDPVERAWKAVQFRDLRRDAPYYEAAMQARMAERLVGMGFEINRKGRYFELGGVSQSVIAKFSRRTQRIEAEARAKGITDPKEKAKLGAKTRGRKAKHLTMEELRSEWAGRLTPDEADALAAVGAAAREREGRPGAAGIGAREALSWAADHQFERNSSVPARELVAEALRHGVGQVGVEEAWRHLERDGRFTADVNGRLYAASRPVLAEERRLVALAREGRATRPALNPGYAVEDAALNPGQRAAVHHLLGSTDFVTMVIGGAGVGKTRLLKEAVRGAQQAGVEVLAFAPSAAASRVNMRAEGFEGADTVASLLTNKQLQARARGQVILIDEAALMGTRETAAVLALSKDLEARVILVGDDRQHRSVSRGSPFELLQAKAGLTPAKVVEIVRQRGTYRQAVELARDRPGEAFDRLCGMGWVREIPADGRYQALAADYLEAVRPVPAKGELRQPTALVVAPTHVEGARVTAAIRDGLRREKRLGEEREFTQLVSLQLTEAARGDAANYEPGDLLQYIQNAPGHTRGERVAVGEAGLPVPPAQAARFQAYRPAKLMLAAGDRVRVTQNGATADGHRLNNGEILTVAGFTAKGDLVDHRGWVIPREYGHLAHGYVVTSHAAQSRTVDRVLVAMGSASIPALSREQFYVDLSRGREWARLYVEDTAEVRKAVGRDAKRVSATELAARRRAQRSLRARTARHVAILQRRVAQERAGPQRTVDTGPHPLPDRLRHKEHSHERA
jgi:conjugative relaxase-like TrwC/TraI family protein